MCTSFLDLQFLYRNPGSPQCGCRYAGQHNYMALFFNLERIRCADAAIGYSFLVNAVVGFLWLVGVCTEAIRPKDVLHNSSCLDCTEHAGFPDEVDGTKKSVWNRV